MDKRDLIAAAEAFRHVLELDPSLPNAHSSLGVVYMMQNRAEDGISEFRKEEQAHPNNPIPYEALAQALMQLHRNDEAMEQWRRLLKVEPTNRDAAIGLGALLTNAKKYSEAISVLESAAKLSTDSEALQTSLGYAYLKNGQSDMAVPLLEKVAQSSKPENLNNIAYELADANVDLDKALAYAEKAVEQTEAQSLLFGASSTESLKIVRQLVAYWDTLGWVYFRHADLGKAESYLRAAWDLSQSAVIGDHLAQVYERQAEARGRAHLSPGAVSSPRKSGRNSPPL